MILKIMKTKNQTFKTNKIITFVKANPKVVILNNSLFNEVIMNLEPR